MAAQLPARDPDTLTFETTVTSIDDQTITLEETYFYAESGGQPADRGTLDGIEVEHAYREDGKTQHLLASTPDIAVGDTVEGVVDASFRRYCMAAHTASHAVYGAARQRFDSLGYGGFEITPTKVRLDLETPTPIDDAAMLELERLTNQVIWEDRPVTWSEVPAEAVREDDEVALNVATDVVHTAETVRIVEIEDWDIAACGGTHLSSTGPIGAIAMADRSNPGEGLTRLEFVVGEERIEQHHEEKAAAWEAKAKLGVPVEEIPERIDRLKSERQALEDRLESMERAVASAAVTGPAATHFEHNGTSWAIGIATEVPTDTATEVAESLSGDVGDVVAIAGGEDRTHLVVVSDAEPPATEVIDTVLDGVEGGGGGGTDMQAQAGGIADAPSAVVERIRETYATD